MADVLSPSFLIGNATVMLAPQGSDVFALKPDTDSVGMVKQVAVTMESDQIELRNGILQSLVDSQKSGVRLTVTFEGYEFTAANLYRALGYAYQTVVQRRRGKLTAAITGPVTTISVASFQIPGDSSTAITAVGQIPVGATILLQKANVPDYVYPARVTATTTGSGPYVITVAVPTGMAFGVDDIVWVVNEVDVGSTRTDDFFCMKIAGKLSANNVPLVLIFPKVKITKGFNMTFSETDYSNMPFEVAPYFLSAVEATGRLAEIGTTMNGRAYIGA